MALAAFERDLRRSGIVLRSPDALRRIATAQGELGFARAFVADAALRSRKRKESR
jgi:hypothetical protein